MAAKQKQDSTDCTEATETRQKVSETYREIRDAINLSQTLFFEGGKQINSGLNGNF